MSRSTGPVLAIGGVTLGNVLLFDDGPADWNEAMRVVVATGIVAGTLSVLERGTPELAVGLAWAAFVTMMLARVGGRPSPTERLLSWWEQARK